MNFGTSAYIGEKKEIKLESLKVLRLEPNDILIFKIEDLLKFHRDREQIEKLESYFSNKLGYKVVAVDSSVEVSAIRPVKDKE